LTKIIRKSHLIRLQTFSEAELINRTKADNYPSSLLNSSSSNAWNT